MAVTLNGERYLSDPFTVDYTAAPTPTATVSDVTIDGTTGTAIADKKVIITLANDTFAPTLSGSWITNLPAGCSHRLKRLNRTAPVHGYPPTDTDNYETLTGTIRLYRRSSGGGGGRSTSRYTVSFESNGGSKVSNQTVTRNSVMKEPTAPAKENFDFDGWYSDKELKTKYDFSAKVTILITIGSATLKVNGKEIKLDSPAFIENDRTYTPIRFISENLGASVEWVEKDQKVIITKSEIKKAETK